jgi:hypothetical protein
MEKKTPEPVHAMIPTDASSMDQQSKLSRKRDITKNNSWKIRSGKIPNDSGKLYFSLKKYSVIIPPPHTGEL